MAMPANQDDLLVTGHPSGTIVLEDHLFFLFTQVIGHRDRILDVRLQPLGLSASKWRIIGTLAPRSMLAMRELAELTTIDRTTLTRALDQLEAAGAAIRVTDADDKRVVRVALTKRGMNLFADANAIVEKINEEITQDMTAEEADVTRGILKRIRARTLGIVSDLARERKRP